LDVRQEFADFTVAVDEDLPLSRQGLAGTIEPFEEDHNGWVIGIGVELKVESASAFGRAKQSTYSVKLGKIRVVIEVKA
jgi:hypothetical protein